MIRRNSVNINELINRFEPTDDDFGMAGNVKFVQVTRPKGNLYTVHDEDEGSYDDENSLIKYRQKFSNRGKSRGMSNAFEITKQTIAMVLHRISGFLEMVSKFPFPRMSVMSFGLASLLSIFICPRSFTERALYPGFRIIFSIIYPAYRSFKAVRNKNLKEYLKWIVYWIVYAFYTCIELLTDALLSWFPFYFEIKVIVFIWLLGPSSRGAMKIYKSCIHPMLVSREQEIDDIIQTAQDRGYMHVLRLGSKSVNYANKIIMQEAKAADSYLVSHQLMKNMSLSNLSDADTILSNDEGDDALRLRKYSTETVPVYGNQFNYPSFEHFEQRRKPSIDYSFPSSRCDEISSGYSSPDPYFRHHPMRSQAYIEGREEDREMYYRNLSRNPAQPEMEQRPMHFDDAYRDVPRRKASINELSEDEIVFAYNKLRAEKIPTAVELNAGVRNEDLSGEMKEEFQKWMQLKRKDEKENPSVSSSGVNSVKVKTIDESDTPVDVVSVVNDMADTAAEEVAERLEPVEEFEEFKDVISDEEESVDEKHDEEYLKVPLVIREDDEAKSVELSPAIPTVVESEFSLIDSERSQSVDENSEPNTIDAKLTLSNAPLEVKTSLSSSNFSLASDKSGDDAMKKRPANHKKGQAPLPPANINVIPGTFYDHVTKKHFKETEL